jgi:5-methylcytosine-specific restriction endonuclease McrA
MQQLSRVLRANHPFCQVCNVKPSAEVHHRFKWRDNPGRRLDASTLVVCCRACHEQLEKIPPA